MYSFSCKRTILIGCFIFLSTNSVYPQNHEHEHEYTEDGYEAREDGSRGQIEIAERRFTMDEKNGDPSPIMFPNHIHQHRSNNLTNRSSKKPVPLKFLRSLSNERDVSKVFEKYVTNVRLQDVNGQKYVVDLRGDPIDAGLGGPTVLVVETTENPTIQIPKFFGQFSNRNIPKPPAIKMAAAERVGVTTRISKPAICEPELKTVEIPSPNDPSIVQFPRCVRLERCGGCCGSDLLTCEPIRSKQTEVQVQKFGYNDETEKLEYKETEVMILQSHVECRCNCRTKASDCSPRHTYNSEDCLCNCKNRGEQELCLQKRNKLWDGGTCECVCREIKVCPSGFIFDLESCECVRNPDRRDDVQNPTRRNRREHVPIRFSRQG